MNKQLAIRHLGEMHREAQRHYAKAKLDHGWRDTQEKWANRRDALDLAIRELIGEVS